MEPHMRISIQLSKENRLTFFDFENGEMGIFKITKSFVYHHGDCIPHVVIRDGLNEKDNKKLDSLIKDLREIYKNKQPQLTLNFGE